MARWWVVVPLVALAACSTSEPEIGSPQVHTSIDAETNCVELQASFELAMGNHDAAPAGSEMRKVTLSYADHIVRRQEQIGC